MKKGQMAYREKKHTCAQGDERWCPQDNNKLQLVCIKIDTPATLRVWTVNPNQGHHGDKNTKKGKYPGNE